MNKKNKFGLRLEFPCGGPILTYTQVQSCWRRFACSVFNSGMWGFTWHVNEHKKKSDFKNSYRWNRANKTIELRNLKPSPYMTLYYIIWSVCNFVFPNFCLYLIVCVFVVVSCAFEIFILFKFHFPVLDIFCVKNGSEYIKRFKSKIIV